MVITYQKGLLHKNEYDTIIHAQAIHGQNILLAGKCYGHMRVLLVNSEGRLLDVINTMITRIPKKQVSHKRHWALGTRARVTLRLAMPMNYAYGSAVTEAMSFLLPCIPDLITCVNEYVSFTTTIVTKHITPGNISYHITTHHHYHYHYNHHHRTS